MNGYFQLVITPKGTGIKVYPPTDGGEPLNVNDVRDYLDDRKIQHDVVIINDAVTKADESVVIFTEAQLMPAAACRSFFFISLSIKSFHNFL